MSLSLKLTPKEVHQLTSPRDASPSRLAKSARLAERLAVKVENDWENLSPEARELLVALAYDATREQRSVGERLKLKWHRLKLALTLVRGQEEMHTVSEYVESMQRLIDAILLAIENEDEAYQENVAKVLKHAISKPEISEP